MVAAFTCKDLRTEGYLHCCCKRCKLAGSQGDRGGLDDGFGVVQPLQSQLWLSLHVLIISQLPTYMVQYDNAAKSKYTHWIRTVLATMLHVIGPAFCSPFAPRSQTLPAGAHVPPFPSTWDKIKGPVSRKGAWKVKQVGGKSGTFRR